MIPGQNSSAGMIDEARRFGRQWRQNANALPVLDWRQQPPPRIHPDGAQYVAAIGLVALFSRETGYWASEMSAHHRMDSCVRLVVCYENPIGRKPWPQDHAITTALCEGFFGSTFLYEVLAQAPDNGADSLRQRWNFRLFTRADWKTPITRGHRPLPYSYMTWAQRLRHIAAEAAPSAIA